MNIFNYIQQNANALFSKTVLHDINGMVLTKTADRLFELHVLMSDEVKEYCKQQGYKVDKVVFITCYDSPLIKQLSNVTHIKLDSDARISIVEDEGGNIIARVLMASHMEFKEEE